MTNTLVIIGHPNAGSFNHALAAQYLTGLRAASVAPADLRVIDLAEREFDLLPTARGDLRAPDGDTSHLEPRIRAFVDDVAWADHLVFFFPQWWGTYPAVLKAFLDRAILSGTAFTYGRGQISTRLLDGKTARIVMTMDSPIAWNRFVYRNAAETSLKRATLGYCGVRTIGITRLTPVRFSTPEKRAAWLEQVRRLGATDAARARRRQPAVAVASPVE
ncbi:NAD(P)H-dependent oxidoreductase [Agromyces sp. Leaf222]|uniref:NAD(P)H-dependent oxidoreductase n=1 Tax=Agromyces sp. Leaf222 TaxID=1735688 RepID=UPI000701EEFD|nr:NAD(P)H-dependent oxidoreductase [Agromyces sp. Leaf222]KQM80986.1 NAD(P)H dehydrogenase [Agromyces sp. Leaf222]